MNVACMWIEKILPGNDEKLEDNKKEGTIWKPDGILNKTINTILNLEIEGNQPLFKRIEKEHIFLWKLNFSPMKLIWDFGYSIVGDEHAWF